MTGNDVDAMLASLEGRAFADRPDALAALAEAARVVSAGWASADFGADRELQLRIWLTRLLAIADRVALYGGVKGLTVTAGSEGRVDISVALDVSGESAAVDAAASPER